MSSSSFKAPSSFSQQGQLRQMMKLERAKRKCLHRSDEPGDTDPEGRTTTTLLTQRYAARTSKPKNKWLEQIHACHPQKDFDMPPMRQDDESSAADKHVMVKGILKPTTYSTTSRTTVSSSNPNHSINVDMSLMEKNTKDTNLVPSLLVDYDSCSNSSSSSRRSPSEESDKDERQQVPTHSTTFETSTHETTIDTHTNQESNQNQNQKLRQRKVLFQDTVGVKTIPQEHVFWYDTDDEHENKNHTVMTRSSSTPTTDAEICRDDTMDNSQVVLEDFLQSVDDMDPATIDTMTTTLSDSTSSVNKQNTLDKNITLIQEEKPQYPFMEQSDIDGEDEDIDQNLDSTRSTLDVDLEQVAYEARLGRLLLLHSTSRHDPVQSSKIMMHETNDFSVPSLAFHPAMDEDFKEEREDIATHSLKVSVNSNHRTKETNTSSSNVRDILRKKLLEKKIQQSECEDKVEEDSFWR